MRKITLNNLIALISFSFLNFANSEDKKSDNSDNTELNFFTGMFDFSDDKQRAGVFGIQLSLIHI